MGSGRTSDPSVEWGCGVPDSYRDQDKRDRNCHGRRHCVCSSPFFDDPTLMLLKTIASSLLRLFHRRSDRCASRDRYGRQHGLCNYLD